MSTIPYFLRNPALDDQGSQPMTMAPAAAPQGMAAQVIQHPMHAMIAPIVGAPKLPRISSMQHAEDPGPEPAEMSQSDISGIGGDQPMSTLPAQKQPKVVTMSPTDRYEDNINRRLMGDYSKDQDPWGSADNHPGFLGKLGHFGSQLIANAHHVSGELTPRETEEQRLGGEVQKIEGEKSQQALQGAQMGNQQAETNLHNTQEKAAQLVEISPEEAQSMGNPALAGQQVTQGVYQHLLTNATTVQGRHDIAEMNNTTKSDIADANNLTKEKLAQLKPQQRDDRAIGLWQKKQQGQPLTQEENAYLGAYNKWIDETKVKPGVARAEAFGAFRPVQVLGENGNVQYQFSGNAIKSGVSTPQSMNFRTAAGMAKFMTSGKGGQTVTAYNTANDHLDLLGKAMEALQNGDVQGLNQLNNSFKQQFGSAAPTNVNAVKAMLAGELANVAKVTGATDQEINEQKANINRAASPEQIKGFIDTNHDLMDQKAYEMYQQYQQGMQGQPAFGTGRPLNGPGGTHPAQSGGNAPQRPAGVPANAQYTTDPKTGKKGWAW